MNTLRWICATEPGIETQSLGENPKDQWEVT
jgi:hypothetical protein